MGATIKQVGADNGQALSAVVTEVPSSALASGAEIEDLTTGFSENTGISIPYHSTAEIDLAQYAMSCLIKQYGQVVRHAKCAGDSPSSASFNTSVNDMATVYHSVAASVVLPCGAVGIVQAYSTSNGMYWVTIGGKTHTATAAIEAEYRRLMEEHNFYQGKALRYTKKGVEFIPRPSVTLEDVTLPAETLGEYQLNVVDFLTDERMSSITKKRGIILHGAPGTGKTTSVKALFNTLTQQHVTCIYICDDAFRKYSIEDVFAFINTYLCPCLVVLEDVDLIATDRSNNNQGIIGSLLSALNGVEAPTKPIVVMATTNRPEVLDAAVTRPCRFDRKIKVDYPSSEELVAMFTRVAGFEPPAELFRQPDNESRKLTGAHVEEIYCTAALLAAQADGKVEDYVDEAVKVIRKHFFMVAPSTAGFAAASEPDAGPPVAEDECVPATGDDEPASHW
jgi:predicted AAA+ superfamily ATPase